MAGRTLPPNPVYRLFNLIGRLHVRFSTSIVILAYVINSWESMHQEIRLWFATVCPRRTRQLNTYSTMLIARYEIAGINNPLRFRKRGKCGRLFYWKRISKAMFNLLRQISFKFHNITWKRVKRNSCSTCDFIVGLQFWSTQVDIRKLACCINDVRNKVQINSLVITFGLAFRYSPISKVYRQTRLKGYNQRHS